MIDYLTYENPFLFVVLGLAACMAVGAIAGLISRAVRGSGARRARELEGLALELGLEFSSEGMPGVPERLEFLSRKLSGLPMEAADGPELVTNLRWSGPDNVIRGRLGGREVLAFDDWRPTAEAQRAAEGRPEGMSVLMLTDGWDAPHLAIRRKRWDDRLAASLGIDDVDFESNREFSDRFYVYCRDASFARRFVTPEAMSYLLANPGWYIELCGSDALIYDLRIWKPARFKEALEVLGGFLDLASAPAPDDAAAGRPAG